LAGEWPRCARWKGTVTVKSKNALATIWGCFLLACGGGGNLGEDRATPTLPEAASEGVSLSPEATGVVMASIQVSPTHKVEFAHYPEERVFNVREWFHADQDDVRNTIKARVAADAPLAEIYHVMAGDQFDPAVAERLQQEDLNLEVVPEPRYPSTSPITLEEDLVDTAPIAAGLGVQRAPDVKPFSHCSGAQPQPPDSDIPWFEDNFCPAGTEYCGLFASEHRHTGATKTRFSESFHFNQGFCYDSQFFVQNKYFCISDLFSCISCTKNVQSGTVSPRFVVHQHWRREGTDACGEWPRWTVIHNLGSDLGMMHNIHN
jgi:hypothetical protein